MREEPLDALLREGLEGVLYPPEEREDWDLTPTRLSIRCALEGHSSCVNRVQRID